LNLSSGIGLLVAGLIFVVVIILIPGGFMSAIDAILRVLQSKAARR
jgi:hypothetical protein